MKKIGYLNRLIQDGTFYFSDLILTGIDNGPVVEMNRPEIVQEETCLFHRDVSRGDQYLQQLHTLVCERISSRDPAPVVRFADGEYAFYANDLHCNGLYQQAESVKAIKKALPRHMEAMRVLSRTGKMAPLVYPGNTEPLAQGLLSFLKRKTYNRSALRFIDFLYDHQVSITGDNYVPFYVVYAYLISREFAEAVDQRRLCIISSECNAHLCGQWFERLSSKPEIIFIPIPESYVGTQWQHLREGVMVKIPSDIEVCLVGAGVGSLPVCVDVAARFSVPAIDAGHVLNLMNGREDKSGGPRLYTVRKKGKEAAQSKN